MLRITIDNEVYDFNEDRLMISEVILLKRVAGLTPEQLFDGLRNRSCTADTCKGWASPTEPCEVEEHKRSTDFEAIKAMCWLAVRRAKGTDTPKWTAFDFDLNGFDLEEVIEDEPSGDGELDPTSAGLPATEKTSK